MPVIRLAVVVMICLFLLHPSQGLARTYSISLHIFQNDKSETSFAGQIPCPECPCPDKGHDDCSFNCSCCSFIPTLSQQLPGRIYPPLERSAAIADPYRQLPQVYLPIFVPPQNQV